MYQFLSVIFLIGAVQCYQVSDLPVIPCQYNDFSCMIMSYNRHYRQEIVPNYGLDSLKIKKSYNIRSHNFIMTYENPVMEGLRACVFSQLKIDFPTRKLNATFSCRNIVVTGKYRASGLMLGVGPVNGVGPFFQILYNNGVSFMADIDIYTGPDHEKHMKISRLLSRTYEPEGAIIAKYKNLVVEDKMASHAAQHRLDENSRAFLLAYVSQMNDPFLLEFLEIMNSYQAKVPLQYLFSQPEYECNSENGRPDIQKTTLLTTLLTAFLFRLFLFNF